MSLEPCTVRHPRHRAPSGADRAGRDVCTRLGRDRRPAGAAPRGERARRGGTGMDSLALRTSSRDQRAAARAGVQRRRDRPARLSARQSDTRAARGAVRLFVAINFPETLRQGLWSATESLRSGALPVRWVKPEAMHLTLKFLGDLAAERQDELAGALRRAAASSRAVTVTVADFGAFPDPRLPRLE